MHWGLSVSASAALTRRGAGGWCDGISVTAARVVLYRRTGNRRENFTLAHELGHLLVEEDAECLTWLADQEHPLRAREQVCDGIAAGLLIPEAVLHTILGGRPMSATTLTALHDATAASWQACANALASRLPCDGFVALVNLEHGEVDYAARSRGTYPYAWAGDRVPDGHELGRDILPATAVSWWPKFNTNERRRYYLSTETDGGYCHAVFAANDLWALEALHLADDEGEDHRWDGTIRCPTCGYEGPTAFYPCTSCGTATCQKCGECDCDRRNREPASACSNCFASVKPHLLENGLCPACR